LTRFARHAIEGPTPAFVLSATAPGTGKDLAAQVISMITTGRPVSSKPDAKDDAELRKSLLAIAVSGAPLTVFDDCHRFGGPVMSAALTATVIQDRKLGVSEEVWAPLTTTFLATGNNVE